MKSVMTPQQHFAQIAKPKIQRSTFDRSHGYKTTFDAGLLIPIFVDEALPGDTINLKCTVFGRLNTPLKPIMDNLFADVHFFAVPERLLWEHWQEFNGEQPDPDPTFSTSYIMPTMTSTAVTGYTEGSIFDYFTLPTKIAGLEHRCDFLRAYNLIWNEWYRDENLQDRAPFTKDDGPDSPTDYALLPRGKRKDYFTGSLPWAQKALPVTIPIGTSAPVIFDVNDHSSPVIRNSTTHAPFNSSGLGSDGAGTFIDEASGTAVQFDPNTSLIADLTNATAATVNALRESFQVQTLYELDARGGTRYTELLRVHFGVISPDARLQRPEFLGGYTTRVNVNPIAQNSATGVSGTPQGNLAGVGTFGSSKNGFIKSFTEHEIIIGMISVRADLNYQQGLDRMWSRSTRFDFFWPSLAHLGEQPIYLKEIYAQGTADDDDVWGYNERYAEYRYKPSHITGLFRSNATQSLDIWHLAQEFSSAPSLNDTFIVEQPPIDRVVAVPSQPDFMLDCWFDFKHTRPMPVYGTPQSLTKL